MAREARYLHISEALQHQIASLPPDSVLGSEHDLARRFGVSRVTIRRALGLLERSGSVSRRRGRGTIVNPVKITRWLAPMHTFEEDLHRQGVAFETHVLEYVPHHVPREGVLERLQLPAGTSVGFLSLQRLVGGHVVCLDQSYFPPEIAPRFQSRLVAEHPVAELLHQLCGEPITSADWTTEIIAATREVAVPLGITPGVLILVNTGTEFLANGRPIQIHTMSYRIDRVRFRFAMNFALSSEGRAPDHAWGRGSDGAHGTLTSAGGESK